MFRTTTKTPHPPATYVTYTGFNSNELPIRIYNFVLVEDINVINEFFSNMTGWEDSIKPDDYQCISIWNANQRYYKVVGDDEYTLQMKYGMLDNRNSIFIDDTGDNSRYITAPPKTCRIKEIFKKLTRFTDYQLKVGNKEDNVLKTLDNRIIFVQKLSIKHLFENLNGENPGIKPAFKTTQGKKDGPINYNIICNFFKNFADIDNIPAAGSVVVDENVNENRDAYGFTENEIIDDNLEFFGNWINGCRKINIDANDIINDIYNILLEKTSKEHENKILTPTPRYRQHYLGFIDKEGSTIRGFSLGGVLPKSFRRLIKENYEKLLNSTNDKTEKLIIYILAITATNGLNFKADCTLKPLTESVSSGGSTFTGRIRRSTN